MEQLLKEIKEDPDFDRNVAIYVPIIRTTDGNYQISYINPGFKLVDLKVEYNQEPAVEIDGSPFGMYKFAPTTYQLPVLVHRELRVPADKRINTRSFTKMLPTTFDTDYLDKVVEQLEVG